jgi:hypothetical protein
VAQDLFELQGLLRKRMAELEPQNALMRMVPSTTMPNILSDSATPEGDAIDPLTESLRSHTGLVWLDRSPEVAAARLLFSKRKAPRRSPWQRAQEELEFLETLAVFIGVALSDPDWRPRVVTAAIRRKSARTTKALLDLVNQGAGLLDVLENDELKRLLEMLIDELSLPKRKAYSGEDLRQRFLLTALARQLLWRVKKQALVVTIVSAVAPAMGFDPEHRTIQRYVKTAVEDDQALKRLAIARELSKR